MIKSQKGQTTFRYKQFVCYDIIGAVLPSSTDTAVILNKKNIKASMHSKLDQMPDDAYRSEAIRDVFILGLTRSDDSLSRDEQIKKEIQRRKNENSDIEACYVSFEFDGDIAIDLTENIAFYEDFDVALEDDFPHKEIDKKHKSVIDGLLSSVSLSIPQYQGHQRVYKSTVIYREGRPLHILTLKMTASGYTILPITDTHIKEITRYARKLTTHQDLVNTSRLLTKSFDQDADRLLAFIAAWNGLEILINKNSKKLETSFYKQKIKAEDAHTEHVLSRLRKLSDNRLRANDNFAILASLLELPVSDLLKFNQIKDVRDRLMHGNDISIETLPLEATQALLDKVLGRYIEARF